MQKRAQAAIGVDFYEPFTIDFVRKLRNHVFEVAKLNFQTIIKRVGIDSISNNARDFYRVFVNRNATPFEPRSRCKLRNVSAFEFVLMRLLSRFGYGGNLAAQNYDETIDLFKRHFDRAGESSIAHIGDKCIDQHVAGSEPVVKNFSARYEHSEIRGQKSEIRSQKSEVRSHDRRRLARDCAL